MKKTICTQLANLEEFAGDYSILSEIKRFVESLKTKGTFLKNVEFTPQRIETLEIEFNRYNSPEYLKELSFMLEQFKFAVENLNDFLPLMK